MGFPVMFIGILFAIGFFRDYLLLPWKWMQNFFEFFWMEGIGWHIYNFGLWLSDISSWGMYVSALLFASLLWDSFSSEYKAELDEVTRMDK